MYITQNEEMEKYIIGQRPELKNNKCPDCNLIKCVRSFHCRMCNVCIAKYDRHSSWFNRCIGSKNYFPYVCVNTFLLLFYITSIVHYVMNIIEVRNIKGKEFVFHFWIVLLCFLAIKFMIFYSSLSNCLVKNLTDFEVKNWMRLPYLWRNMRKDVYNPFNKGLYLNIREIIECYNDPEIKYDSPSIDIGISDNSNIIVDRDTDIGISISEDINTNTDDSQRDREVGKENKPLTRSLGIFGYLL